MTRRDCAGFTLLEILVALVLMGLAILAAVPLFVYAMESNQTADDVGRINTLAMQQLEVLRSTDYSSLTAGGDLDSNLSGFFDDSESEYLVRWVIADGGSPPAKTITVRAIAHVSSVGEKRQSTITTVRAE